MNPSTPSPSSSSPEPAVIETPASRSPAKDTPANRTIWKILTAFSLGCAGILVVGLLYFATTSVSGIEFNPYTWRVRRFSFRRDPFTNYQLTGLTHTAPSLTGNLYAGWPNTTATPAQSASFASVITTHLKTAPVAESRWDLISIDNVGAEPGKAAILAELLGWRQYSGTNYWVDWSTKNPKKAAVLWPAAQDLAVYDCYPSLPDLFDLATIAQSDDNFSKSVQELVQASLVAKAMQASERGESGLAVQIAKAALAYGDSTVLQRMIDQP